MASSPSANIRPWLIYNGKQKMEKITLTLYSGISTSQQTVLQASALRVGTPFHIRLG